MLSVAICGFVAYIYHVFTWNCEVLCVNVYLCDMLCAVLCFAVCFAVQVEALSVGA